MAFGNVGGLTSIIIPNSVINMGSKVFYGILDLVIYAEAGAKPSGWDENWSPDNVLVIWGYTGN
jgi:hypothetical protein